MYPEIHNRLNKCPILPIRDMIIFPEMSVPIFISREQSIMALKMAQENNDGIITILAQKDSLAKNVDADDLYTHGVCAKIIQFSPLSDDNYKVLIKGISRVKLTANRSEGDKLIGDFMMIYDDCQDDKYQQEILNLRKLVLENFKTFFLDEKNLNTENFYILNKIKDHSVFVDNMMLYIGMPFVNKQIALEEINVHKRFKMVLQYMQDKFNMIGVDQNIKKNLKNHIDKSQKEYYLNEQIKVIRKELKEIGGQAESDNEDIVDLDRQIKELQCSASVKEKLQSELKKMSNMSYLSSEASVIKCYLECCIELPWQKSGEIIDDLKKAEEVLNNNHYGIEKVKDRILEYLAVYRRTKKLNGPILCLHGAPGVGKTSLARSIATATGRKFVKISLGGIKDEAEIRGHRKTYVGAMPGKIIQAIRKVKVNNPVILLDEIDKISADYRGDPSSALLEVLDPEQRHEFQDHYLEVDFDLSNVMFIATANSLDFLRPLLDRMEVIHISSYTEQEKIKIAKNYLVKKQLKDHELNENELEITEESIVKLIRFYTKEAGVRSLNRELAKIARKVVRKISQIADSQLIKVDNSNLHNFCGPPKCSFNVAEDGGEVGMVTGLAYTEYGGTILPIETVIVPGDGKVKCTGKLGEVMQESVKTAFSYLMSKFKDYGLEDEFYKKIDLHVHVPEGATPKDGPSAGLAICLCMLSRLLNKPVPCTLAMTGEITLRGNALQIGGLKEKILAAQRSGIKKVLIPKDNEYDLEEIQELLKDVEVLVVNNFEDVMKIAFTRENVDFNE